MAYFRVRLDGRNVTAEGRKVSEGLDAGVSQKEKPLSYLCKLLPVIVTTRLWGIFLS